jgi:hypothetical protein
VLVVRHIRNRQVNNRKVAAFLAKDATNLDGFVLFDTGNKYEIDFPSGWETETKK